MKTTKNSSENSKNPFGTATSKYHNTIPSLIVTLAFCLTGCMGIYEGGFECPPGKGLGCTSISDVNKSLEGGLASHNPLDPALEIISPSAPCPQNSKIWYAPWLRGSPDERSKPSRIYRKKPRDTSL